MVGLVAWGEGCGKPGVPGAYVRVNYFRDWINDDPTLKDEYIEKFPNLAFRPKGYKPKDSDNYYDQLDERGDETNGGRG